MNSLHKGVYWLKLADEEVKYSLLAEAGSGSDSSEDENTSIQQLPIPKDGTEDKLKMKVSKYAKLERDRLFRRRKQNEAVSHMWPNCCYVLSFLTVLVICITIATIIFLHKSEVHQSHAINTSTPTTDTAGSEGEIPRTFRKDWTVVYEDIGAEGCVRLLDVDGDKKQDIIVAAAIGLDIVGKPDLDDVEGLKRYCKSQDLEYPCMGIVYALRGINGKQLWKIKTRSEVFLINCEDIDVDGDDSVDCIMSGRQATLLAVDPQKGKMLWEWDLKYAKGMWNIYQVLPVPDIDADGVDDVLICHGGDPKIPPDIHNRTSARLILVSGASGKTLGRYLSLPDNRESYASPIMFITQDGDKYVLVGSGGETVSGGLLMISLHDLHKFIMEIGDPTDVIFTQPNRTYPHLAKDDLGFIYLHKTDSKGVMVPPVIVDMTRDGVDDILMSTFEGDIILINGDTLLPEWKRSFPDAESYSTPALGYFDNDDILDFMTHWSYGHWPYYNHSEVVIINSQNARLWSMTTNLFGLTSDLVLHTNQIQRDAFVFSVNGRSGDHIFNSKGEIHGVGIQRLLNETSPVSNKQSQIVTDVEKDYLKSHLDCNSDLTPLQTEVFLMDRSTQKEPVRIFVKEAEKYSYAVEQKTQNKTDGKKQETYKEMCVIMKSTDRITGAIGDVDGDGHLDYISVLEVSGDLRDESYSYLRMKNKLHVSKTDLTNAIQSAPRIPLSRYHEYYNPKLQTEKPLSQLHFKPLAQQKWTQYLGSKGNNHYQIQKHGIL